MIMEWRDSKLYIYHQIGHIIVLGVDPNKKAEGKALKVSSYLKEVFAQNPGLRAQYNVDILSGDFHQYYKEHNIILLPCKSTQRNKSDFSVIQESILWLRAWGDKNFDDLEARGKKVFVPLIGTGKQGVNPGDVQRFMEATLKNARIIGVI